MNGNKGNWSETYALIKLLADQQLKVADKHLNPLPSVFYPITKIIRNESAPSKKIFKIIEYSIDKVKNVVQISEPTKTPHEIVPISEFNANALDLYSDIKAQRGSDSFSLPKYDSFLNKIDVSKLGAKSKDKSDLNIEVHDLLTGTNPILGFSIKSILGQDSTLLNPGAGTNFIFKITPPQGVSVDVSEINKSTYSGKESKAGRRITELTKLGCIIKFDSIQSKNFKLNLELIDSRMPEIIAYLILERFKQNKRKIPELIKILDSINPLGYDLSKHPFYEYKVKNFLVDSALGMTPEKPWDGYYKTTGGIIIVKESGDLVCFHVFNRNDFQDYLLNISYLEGPSTGEDKDNPGNKKVNIPGSKKKSKEYYWSWVYEEGGDLFIKLNLQVRFGIRK
ncbi:MAG: hypothetical protein ACI9GZ_001611 [Bacteroidia bacterium]|jgi:type II restriction enzyme